MSEDCHPCQCEICAGSPNGLPPFEHRRVLDLMTPKEASKILSNANQHWEECQRLLRRVKMAAPFGSFMRSFLIVDLDTMRDHKPLFFHRACFVMEHGWKEEGKP